MDGCEVQLEHLRVQPGKAVSYNINLIVKF